MAMRIMQEVLKSDIVPNINQNRQKDIDQVKMISRFYADYCNQFEKNLQKGDHTFPTLPLKFNMYKTLSHYNSNDKVVEKKYRSVGTVYF